jgi:hypothetical protein
MYIVYLGIFLYLHTQTDFYKKAEIPQIQVSEISGDNLKK